MENPLKRSCLYHYTSFESATKILASRCLRFSDIAKLNDINESCGPTIICDEPEDYGEVEILFRRYSQISLTMDKELHFGFDIPAMWGHYARSGHGACLVLDKERCLLEAKAQDFYSKAVEYYSPKSLNDIEYKRCYGSLSFFIERAKDTLFFHKTPDWEYEQEYRIITNNGSDTLFSIKDSLFAVILFSRTHNSFFNSIEYQVLSKISPELEFYRYASPLGQYELFDREENNLRPPLMYEFKRVNNNENLCNQ